TPAIASLARGIEFVEKNGVCNIRRHESSLARALKNELLSDCRFTVYDEMSCSGIVLFNVKDMPSNEVSSELDRRGICVRAGFHCAPLAHKTLGTSSSGAVRVSFGAFNEMRDVKIFLDSIIKI
ncbi:MAG: aminotransferase class V-fold PLP-dependent enzyme, partial [Clostridia bacterium]|nr:aminotransferase class V-fold PLP-dependent enzyme [Clostridia bacterium]